MSQHIKDQLEAPTYDAKAAAADLPGAAASFIMNPPRWLLRLLRNLFPIFQLGGWAAVLRFDDVSEVLTRPDIFSVPFGDEMARLNDGCAPGTHFILGIDKKKEHDSQLAWVMQAFKRSDVEKIVVPQSRECAERAVSEAKAVGETVRLDAIEKLVTAVPLEICRRYYGVCIPENHLQKFAYATIDVSGHLFGPPPIEPKPVIDKAADYLRYFVNQAISAPPPGTVVARLRSMQAQEPSLTDAQIRSFLMGMIVGFVPTNTMAGGHILEMLLSRKVFMDAAREAAVAGDDDLLKHCLFESMRFMPLNPGPFRICEQDYIVAAGTPRAATIKNGTKVLASTLSAMFDTNQIENPDLFNPARPASDYMLFGYGIHWCVGVFIAQAQITQTFKVLLTQPNLRRATDGELRLRGLFPDHLFVEFDREKAA